MKNVIKYDIDEHAGNGSNEHDCRAFHKFFVDDTLSRLNHDKDHHSPDYENVSQSSNQLHSVISKRHSFIHLLLGQVKEHEREDESEQVTYQMDRI